MQQRTPKGEGAPVVWPTLTTVLSVVVAASAVVFGMAVLAGWLYTREYYRQFGIEPSALSFSAYDYALRAKFALSLVLSGLVGTLLGLSASESAWLRRVLPSDLSKKELTVAKTFGWAFLAIIVGSGLTDWFTVRSGVYLIDLICGLSIWIALVTTWFSQRRTDLYLFGAASIVAVFAVLLFYVPGAQGESDGRKDHEHVSRFPAVSVMAVQELGLPRHESIEAFHKYGPYRLVLRNGGMYYLVAEDQPNETLAVREELVTYLELHRQQ